MTAPPIDPCCVSVYWTLPNTVMFNFHCQLDRMESHLGDMPLGVSVKEFLHGASVKAQPE